MYKQNACIKEFFKVEFVDGADKKILLEPVKVKKSVANRLAYSIQDSIVEFVEKLA